MWEIECPYKSSLKGVNEIYLKSLAFFFTQCCGVCDFLIYRGCCSWFFKPFKWIFIVYMMGWKYFKMRLIHPLSLSSSSSSLHSQYRNFRFHFFFLFHTFSGRYFSLFHHVHFNSSLYGNSKIHYPSHVLKIPSSLLHEMTSFLNFVQFLSTMQLPLGKKNIKMKWKKHFYWFLGKFPLPISQQWFLRLASIISILFLLHSHYFHFHLHCNYTHDVFSSTAVSYDGWWGE